MLVAGLCVIIAVIGYWAMTHSPNIVVKPETYPAVQAPVPSPQIMEVPLPIRKTLVNTSEQSLPKDAGRLFEDWLAATLKRDGMNSEKTGRLLSEVLHRYSIANQAIFKRILQTLNDPSIDSITKFAILEIIKRAATPSSLRFLLDISKLNLPSDIKQSVLNAISQTGDYYWDKQSYPEIAPMLLQSWMQAQDTAELGALSGAIARVGDVTGINQMLDAVLKKGATLEEIRGSEDARAIAALNALSMVHNPDIIPSISQRLTSEGISSAEASICARLLASTQSVDAARCLLEWAQNADDSYTVTIRETFAGIWDSRSLEYISLTMPAMNFKSASVQAAILSALKRT